MNSRRTLPGVGVLLIGVLFLCAGTAGAESAEWALEDFGEVDLSVAETSIRASFGEAKPHLRITVEDPAIDAATLIVSENQGDILRIQSPDDAPKATFVLEVVLRSDQRLRITGRALDVAIQGTAGASGIDEERGLERGVEERESDLSRIQRRLDQARAQSGRDAATDAADRPAISLDVQDSRVTGRALEDVVVAGQGSDWWFSQGFGTLSGVVEGGRFELVEHQGSIEIETRGSELSITESEGPIRLRSAGGRLELQGCKSNLDVQLRDAALRVERLTGRISLAGESSRAEIRASEAPTGGFDARGQALDLVLEDWKGIFQVAVEQNSRVQAARLDGHAKLALKTASEGEIERVNGKVRFDLEEASSITLRAIRGAVNGKVQSGRFNATDIDFLILEATQSEISIERPGRVGQLDAVESTLDLDWTGISGRPKLQLRGASSADVRLPSPCQVQIQEDKTTKTGDDAEFDISVSDCELRSSRLPNSRSDSPGLDGKQPVVLMVTLDPESELAVTGVY